MEEIFRRRRLPHLDKPGAIYFVTTCLQDSIPACGLADIREYRTSIRKRTPAKGISQRESELIQWKRVFARSDYWLDQAIGANHLKDERLATEVENAILHFAGERYAVWAWTVMSNHLHWVFEPESDWVVNLGDDAKKRTPRERIMHGLKRHSARQCNRLLETSGRFWQDESFDHCVIDSSELHRVIAYVEMNPVKARLCEKTEQFRFSSANYRAKHGLDYGRPLIGTTNLSSFD